MRNSLENLGACAGQRGRLGDDAGPLEHVGADAGRRGRLGDDAGPLEHMGNDAEPLGRLGHDAGPLELLRVEDDGLSTAEYAVGTVAVVGLGGLLIRLLTSDWFFGLLQGIFQGALTSVF